MYVLRTKQNTTNSPGDEDIVIKTPAERNNRIGIKCRKVPKSNTRIDSGTEVRSRQTMDLVEGRVLSSAAASQSPCVIYIHVPIAPLSCNPS